MCGRSSLHDAPVNVLERFNLPPVLPGFQPRYNIAPSQDQWTIALDEQGAPAVSPRRWGLIPEWAKEPSIGHRLINARAESLDSKSAFQTPFRRKRCLVLADGYYEWTGRGKARVPIFFHMSGHRPFAMAGLWDRWDGGEVPLETCTIITTDAGSRTSAYHDRMPAVLTLDGAAEWVDRRTPQARLAELLRAYDESDLECYEVSRLVNSPANDSRECMQPAAEQTII